MLPWRGAGYSIWTNTSYKWPLLASGVACLVGNLAYCLSYDVAALSLLLFARLVTGLGTNPASVPHITARFFSPPSRFEMTMGIAN